MSKHRREPRSLGPCPVCGREMIEDGASVNEHHLVPRSRGGKETTHLHRICHAKLHSRWTERELAERYSSIEAILADEEIAAAQQRPGPGTAHQGDRRTGASADGQAGPAAGGACQAHGIVQDLLVEGELTGDLLELQHIFGVQHGAQGLYVEHVGPG